MSQSIDGGAVRSAAMHDSAVPELPTAAGQATRRAKDQVVVREATAADAAAIAHIYNHYIRNSVATFEEQPVTTVIMLRRMGDVQRASLPWLVAAEADRVVGYAYAAQWNERSAYRFSAQVTAYVDPEHLRCGIGSRLYERIIQILQSRNIHAIIGGISLPNEASVALHEKFGLRKVAHFEQVGFKFNRWVDVGYWQRTL